MPFNGSGTFVSLAPPDFPALPGTVILASSFNANMNDVFTNGLTKCLTRDGQSPPTANLPMSGFKLTGLGNATADTDSVPAGQVLATRGTVGVVDWNTKITNGIFEAVASNLASPATNFPPTSDLGQLRVESQGALVTQIYETATNFYSRKKVGGVFSAWTKGALINQNYVLNSGMKVWQVGTSLGSGTGKRYLMDMNFNNSVGTTYTPSQVAFALGTNTADSRFFKRTAVVSVANAANFCLDAFPIENVDTLNGQVVTVSFELKSGASSPFSVEILQNFGTGGSPSADVTTFLGKVTSTTTFTRYQFTTTLPSVVGKTLGTAGDHLEINIWYDAGSNFNSRTGTLGQRSDTFDIVNLKLEYGAEMTPYQNKPFWDELFDCYRYYVNTAASAIVLWSGQVTSGISYSAFCMYPRVMRIVPTIVTTDAGGASGFPATRAESGITLFGFIEARTANSTGSAGFWAAYYTADARF